MNTTVNLVISPVVIMAVHGDITDIETDVMVNSANTAMVFGGTRSVASRINELTEGRLESILSNNKEYPKPVPLGEICVTESDKLPSRFVFHLSTHGNLEEMVNAANELGNKEELPDRIQEVLLNSIKDGVHNLLSECEERSMARMTIPLIGSGSLNLPKPLAIEVLVGTLSSQLLEKTPEYLREIKIVTPEKSIFDFINDYLEYIELDYLSKNNTDFIMSGGPNSLVESKELPNFQEQRFESRQKLSETDPDRSQDIAYEAIGEISALKRKLRVVIDEKEKLEKDIQIYTEELKILSKRNRELEREKILAKRKIFTRKEAWHRIDLPLPLAYAQNILSSEEDSISRLLNSMTAIGIVNKYFSSLVCAEYCKAGFFNKMINKKLKECFSKPVTDGSWHWIGQTIARAFKDENLHGEVIFDLVKQWLNKDGSWSRFSQVLKDLIVLRNGIHDPVGADQARAKDWLVQFSPLWEEMCEQSADLLNYELLFIDKILLNLPDGRCKYGVKHLKGGGLLPQSGTLELNDSYNPNELLLWDPMKDRTLELSPFIIFEYSQMTNSREAYCLDLIQHTRFQFRAFRYPYKYDMKIEGQIF